MQDYVFVTGMVIKTIPIGDYDRRITILTKERGKINCFAKGSRKPNSRFVASTNPFTFGVFKMYVGKSSYNLLETNISNYFEDLRDSFLEAYYAMYFLEISDYFTRENNDEKNMLKLLYQSLRGLTAKGLSKELVRAIYEIKVVVVQGEFPGIPEKIKVSETASRAVGFIVNSPIEKLFTFQVSAEVLRELLLLGSYYKSEFYPKTFKSLQIIEDMEKLNQ
jgi:DNA repair protein RecO (recombination protein O)